MTDTTGVPITPPGDPCAECQSAARQLVIMATIGGVLVGAGLAWLVLKK